MQRENAIVSILGCGWLGFPLAERLVREGFRVKGASRDEQKRKQLEHRGINSYFVDLQPSPEGPQLQDFLHCDVLIFTVPPGRRRPNVVEFYSKAVYEVIELAKQSGCRQFLFTSSTGVYGSSSGEVDEKYPLEPQRASAQAVVAAEKILRGDADTAVTILRLAGLAGPDRHPGRWLAGKKDVPNGDAPVNLVHLHDVVEAILKVIRQNNWETIYNVCAAKHPKKSDYYPWAARQMNLEPPSFKPGGSSGKIIRSDLIRDKLEMTFAYDDPYLFFD